MITDERPITALATAAGPAGVAILRLSGTGVFEVADRLIHTRGAPPSARPAGTFFHATIKHPLTGIKLDDVLVLIFKAPRSYTGEDAVEIQGHGGVISSQRLLEATLLAGARLAEPGEFTRRAFMNGRLDLTQAEAVADLIQARTDRAAMAAREQLDGALGQKISALYDNITSVCGDIEAVLDLDEGDLPPGFILAQGQTLTKIMTVVDDLLNTWHEGRLLREGALVVIAGRPNVGKSSLLNALLGHDRAIVSAHPGTTRDTIEEGCNLNGIPVRLVDTAGLRETTCEIEQKGVERSQAMLLRADAVLYVIDGSRPPDEDDARRLDLLPVGRSMLVLNKQDLTACITTQHLRAWRPLPMAAVSARTGSGLETLRRLLTDNLEIHCGAPASAAHVTVSARHRNSLLAAMTSMRQARQHLDLGEPGLILAARDLRETAELIGLIIGRTYTDDLLDLIFSRFCIGK